MGLRIAAVTASSENKLLMPIVYDAKVGYWLITGVYWGPR